MGLFLRILRIGQCHARKPSFFSLKAFSNLSTRQSRAPLSAHLARSNCVFMSAFCLCVVGGECFAVIMIVALFFRGGFCVVPLSVALPLLKYKK